jgi:hypothetical protein
MPGIQPAGRGRKDTKGNEFIAPKAIPQETGSLN